MTGYWRRAAEPLTEDAVGELIEEGLHDNLVLLDGVPYDLEDLYRCDGCGLDFVHPGDLDHDALCTDCAREADEAADEQRDLESWARWACR